MDWVTDKRYASAYIKKSPQRKDMGNRYGEKKGGAGGFGLVFAIGLPPGPYEKIVGFPPEEDSCFIDSGYYNSPFSTGVNSSGPRSTISQPSCLMRLGIGVPQFLMQIYGFGLEFPKFTWDFFASATDFFCLVEVPLFLG